MKSVPKLHHYVTRAYMRRFSFDGKHVYTLFKDCRGGIKIPNRPTGVEKICSETDFYTVFDVNGVKNTKVEEILAVYEDSLTSIFNLIRPDLIYPYQEEGAIFGTDIKIRLVDAMAIQFARGKYVRKAGQKVIDKHYNDLFEEARIKLKGNPKASSELEFLKKNREMIKRNALAEGPLIEIFKNWHDSELRNNFQNRKCYIVVNMTGVDFITSDEPVLSCKEIKDDGTIERTAINDQRSIICYPIDAKHLIMLDPLDDSINDGNGPCFVKNLGSEHKGIVFGLNTAQLAQCDRTLISLRRETIENMVATSNQRSKASIIS